MDEIPSTAPVRQPTRTYDALLTHNPVERGRIATLRETMRQYAELFRGKRILDFGASYGLSAVVMIEYQARSVVGVEPDEPRVIRGTRLLAESGLADRISLHYVEDTRTLPFSTGEFDLVVANAVFEHIPQPRAPYVCELWRLLAPGGSLLINETPNKYLPVDFHTLHLPLTNWLPSKAAHWVGVKAGRFKATRTDWDYSGWRGMGYYELVSEIPGPHTVMHETTRWRHKMLRALGLPSALLDPYPVYLITKPATPSPDTPKHQRRGDSHA